MSADVLIPFPSFSDLNNNGSTPTHALRIKTVASAVGVRVMAVEVSRILSNYPSSNNTGESFLI